MYLYFVIMNGFARSEEVVTEPALRVSRCVSILHIVLSCHAMFEIAQTLSKTSIDRIGYHWYADALNRSTVVSRGIINNHCGEQIVVLVVSLNIGGYNQR